MSDTNDKAAFDARLNELTEEATALHPDDWPAANTWLRDQVLADDALFRYMMEPLLGIETYKRVKRSGQRSLRQAIVHAIEQGTPLPDKHPWKPDANSDDATT